MWHSVRQATQAVVPKGFMTNNTMKPTQHLISILKNFARIQPGIIIQPGNILKTRAVALYAEATVEETFPIEVAICDINDYLRTLALYSDPIIDFTATGMHITERGGTGLTRYPYATPGSIHQLPTTASIRPLPDDHMSFEISGEHWRILQKALRLASTAKGFHDAGCVSLAIKSDGDNITLSVQQGVRVETEKYSCLASEAKTAKECRLVLSAGNLPLLPGAYGVTATQIYVRFERRGNHRLTYWTATEPASTWGGAQTYQVRVTQSVAQECVVPVQAHSAEEAEALVRRQADDQWRWTDVRPRKDFHVLPVTVHPPGTATSQVLNANVCESAGEKRVLDR
jgi:hypothetical protein